MKKGFTLIELLAVIVIVAIISLIAIPVISNVVINTKVSALKASANGLLEASNLYRAQYGNSKTIRFDIEDNKITSNDTDKLLSYNGNIKSGTVIIDNKGRVVVCVTDGKNAVYKNYNDKNITPATNEACYIPENNSIVYLENSGATLQELDNQALTEEVANLKAEIASLKSSKADKDTVEAIGTIANSSTLDKAWPIGSIYMTMTESTTEAVHNKLGGTWESYGQGKTLVGVDATQTEFDEVNKTGGEKTHTLTISEMPSHTHTRGTMNITANAGAFGHTGGISYGINLDGSGMTGAFYSYGGTNTYVYSGTGTLYNNTQHHSGFGFDASRSWTGETSSVGGNGSHNNLQPYITVYMYKRIS